MVEKELIDRLAPDEQRVRRLPKQSKQSSTALSDDGRVSKPASRLHKC